MLSRSTIDCWRPLYFLHPYTLSTPYVCLSFSPALKQMCGGVTSAFLMCNNLVQLEQLGTLECLFPDHMLFWLQSEAEASYYHTHKLISTASFDAQTVQSDALFTGKLETRFKNHPKNKTGAGILVSRLKEDGGLPTKVLPYPQLSPPLTAGCCNIIILHCAVYDMFEV